MHFITFVLNKSEKTASMEINGRIVQVLDEQSGTGRNGIWRKRDYILETGGQYPKKICITVWGDKIDQFGMQMGDDVNVGVEVESREYNGRWYTDVKAWRVNKGGASAPTASASPAPDVTTFSEEDGDDILPF